MHPLGPSLGPESHLHLAGCHSPDWDTLAGIHTVWPVNRGQQVRVYQVTLCATKLASSLVTRHSPCVMTWRCVHVTQKASRFLNPTLIESHPPRLPPKETSRFFARQCERSPPISTQPTNNLNKTHNSLIFPAELFQCIKGAGPHPGGNLYSWQGFTGSSASFSLTINTNSRGFRF